LREAKQSSLTPDIVPPPVLTLTELIFGEKYLAFSTGLRLILNPYQYLWLKLD